MKKEEFSFDYDDEVLESFVKQYYADHEIPHEVICPPLGDEHIFAYLEQMRKGKFQLTMKPIGSKRGICKIPESN